MNVPVEYSVHFRPKKQSFHLLLRYDRRIVNHREGAILPLCRPKGENVVGPSRSREDVVPEQLAQPRLIHEHHGAEVELTPRPERTKMLARPVKLICPAFILWLPIGLNMFKLPVRRELAHPALVPARKSKEHIVDPLDCDFGKWCFVVGEDLVPEEGLALIVFECFLSHDLKI